MGDIEQMTELSLRLNEYAKLYYEQDKIAVTDAEYDKLFDELTALERKNSLVLDISPTNRVGGEPLAKFENHRHITRLMSFDKCKTKNELKNWEKRIKKIIAVHVSDTGEKVEPVKYVLEYKFDGLAISLTYQNGKLIQAATRGNGMVGEAILPQVKTIYSIPLKIKFTGLMELQGESIMKLSTLKKYNETAKEPLKNARNAAAGALRNLNPKITKSRKLDAFFYQISTLEGKEINNHNEMMQFMKEMNFKINDYYKTFDNIDDIVKELDEAESTIPQLDFLVDGMVIKVIDYRLREILGYTNRFPRWAIAYKFRPQETSTKLLDVTWQVGRTGRLTPVAELETCDIGGVSIRRATLNNYSDIIRKKVKIGSDVIIRRSNDVIPEIMGVLDNNESGDEIEKIEKCPACAHDVQEVGAHLYCLNSLACPAQVVSKIAHYASRDAMDIETLSEKTAQALHGKLGLKKLSDLYKLTKEDLLKLDGFKDKKAQNVINAIEAKKDIELGRFIYALGISNIGKKTADDLAQNYKTLDSLMNADIDNLLKIRDIGGVAAKSIIDFFNDEQTRNTIIKLLEMGVKPKSMNENKSRKLASKTFVLTGTLSISRRQASDIIKKNGGNISSSVSKNTDFLLAGENAGSKLAKAQELDVKIITLDDLMKLI